MKEELENKKIGKWTVERYLGKINYRDTWLCKCACGTEKPVQQRTLISKQSTSCGCDKTKHINNIQGEKFGKLTVIKYLYTQQGRAYWLCKCECGKTYIGLGKNLLNGNTKSCGCINHGKGQIRKNLKGKKFNSLIPFEYKGIINNHSVWKCKCVCGNIVEVEGYALLKGLIKSCGCKHYPKTDTEELAKIYNKDKTTITFVKRRLFGKGNLCLSKEQREQLDTYFKNTEKHNSSFGERDVLSFIKSVYSGELNANDRTVIFPKELDIYIPEKNLAIEYDGLYWHSEAGDCFSAYHLQKTMACIEKGIRLIHLYDAEWRDKKEIVKSMVLSALGIYERKEYARNCEVREVTDRNTVIKFFDDNHIQGAVHKYSLCLGLYKGEELLQAVVFGKQHFGKNGDTELYRMVTKKNTQVLGGFSKLMKHSPYDTVVSYVALRLFDAKGYLAGNWKIEHQAKPSFCITDGVNMYSRHLFKKERCLEKFDNVTSDMTEREMQVRNGFYRLWDCGTYKVRWNRT